MNERKTVVTGWEGVGGVPLEPGWLRREFTDEGIDSEVRQLIGVIDRQMWTVDERCPETRHER